MPSLLPRVGFSLSVLVCGRLLVVGQFGVGEIDCLQNRARTGVPSGAAPLGWWMRRMLNSI